MALNTAHLNGGVLIHSGESILLFSDNVTLEWSGQDDPVFSGKKHGRMYLTTHRMIYNAISDKEPMQSFSFPFVALSDVDIEQPVFGANYIKGKVRSQPNGNWIGEAKFKLTFKHGGAIDFGTAMLKAAHLATRQGYSSEPPPYNPPQGNWYEAPPSAYAFNPTAYYGWIPPTAMNAFPDRPPSNTVFMSDAPPPYPGVIGFQTPPQQGNYPPPQQGGYPSQQGSYPPQQGSYPPQQGGYPPQQGGYPPQQGGYLAQQGGYPPQQGGYPPQQGGYPPQNGYPSQGATGFQHNSMSSADAKAAEAAQSAYYDPNRPQMAYVPPPAYYENPPNYYQATDKKTQ
ncbi:WW domain-binding protein 2 isoform X2 [Agrilus planipennis]|uniref:WW domain-binding protein 2 isoform X1 n=1 Tax=Agrilus planipennis TaxID=224129 RepID=A0A1W4WQQ8_AGRPL|nr:WW domain-binding protein 2 isoform X1 [Agrilus planipennis]XP_025831265.1 WW domain-binding protein 2 isoform X2 [Agrilus planipennis]